MPDIDIDQPDEEILTPEAIEDDEEPREAAGADDDPEAEPEGKAKPKKKSWLSEASELKRQAEESRTAAEEAKREAAELKARLERLERPAEKKAAPSEKKREALSGDKLIDVLAEKGEAGLSEILDSYLSDRLAAQRESLEQEFENKFRVRDDIATLVRDHSFMSDSNSDGYKLAEAQQAAAAKRDPKLANNIEVWRMAAQNASLRLELAALKKQRKAGSSSGLVGSPAGGDDDDYVALPEEATSFMRAANAHLGKHKLTPGDIRRAMKVN